MGEMARWFVRTSCKCSIIDKQNSMVWGIRRPWLDGWSAFYARYFVGNRGPGRWRLSLFPGDNRVGMLWYGVAD